MTLCGAFHLLQSARGRYSADGLTCCYMELQKGKTKKTSLDVTPDNRHEVLWGILIGRGGGYQQECAQAFSPVAAWIREVDLALTDEGQQYGNIEETSVVARIPRTCLTVWAGDHRQTPGGLVKRPLALVVVQTTFNHMSCTRLLKGTLMGQWPPLPICLHASSRKMTLWRLPFRVLLALLIGRDGVLSFQAVPGSRTSHTRLS